MKTLNEKQMEYYTKIQKHIKELAPDLVSTVEKIESSIKTTQNNYGSYLNIILQVPDTSDNDGNTGRFIVACALIRAGGDKLGVTHALKIATGLDYTDQIGG